MMQIGTEFVIVVLASLRARRQAAAHLSDGLEGRFGAADRAIAVHNRRGHMGWGDF